MRERFDIFRTLPDVIKDDFEDIDNLDARLKEFAEKKRQANALDLRYAAGAISDDQRWSFANACLRGRM